MEEELRQPVRQQVRLAADAAFLRRAGAQQDLALIAALPDRRLVPPSGNYGKATSIPKLSLM
jgi:hypothetical protein